MKVREIMKKIETIGPKASVKDAAELMIKLNVDALIVIRDSRVIGILTDGDILKRFISQDKLPSDVKVEEIMTTKIIKISPEEPIEYASRLMIEKNIKQLPVINKGRMIGMLTASEIAKHAPLIGMDSLL